MNLKEYNRLTDLFGKLNSQEKLEDDFTTIPEGGKLKFFWEKCGHEKIDASSIIERTKQKIRRDVMRRRRNYFLVASASVAASILICISTIHFLTHSENTNLDFQAIAEQMDSQSVEEVTLITAKEQLNLDEDAFVTYSKEGKVADIFYDPSENVAVIRAAKDLQNDIQKVTGKLPYLLTTETSGEFEIIIGTVGTSKQIDQLISSKKINAKDLKGKWESFVITTVGNSKSNSWLKTSLLLRIPCQIVHPI